MRCLKFALPIQVYILSLILIGLQVILTGCSLKEIKEQTTLIDNIGVLKGKVVITSQQEGPVMVLRFMDENGIPVLQHTVIASKNGEYEFNAIPGKHYIAAYIDINRDGKRQKEEHGNFYGSPTAIDVANKQTVTAETVTISGPLPELPPEIKPIDRSFAAWKNIGKVVTLDDPRFNQDNYTMGLWQPLDFLEKAEGGLFFLQEYQKDKVPVLFVHGVLNGPTLWKQVVESLDTEHFQPWVCYYPSGLRLDMLSNYLVKAVSQLQEEFGFKEYYVVAHSMGGLVARSFVKKYIESDPKNSKILRLVITVNSPMAGMSAAASGVKSSPIVVPSWRDVQPGSEFLQDIHKWQWPEEIPYHLVISYLDGKSGDGVVPLQSQSQLKLQSEATRLYIFNNDHSGTINDKDFQATLNMILNTRREN